jgi:hypothetical protein
MTQLRLAFAAMSVLGMLAAAGMFSAAPSATLELDADPVQAGGSITFTGTITWNDAPADEGACEVQLDGTESEAAVCNYDQKGAVSGSFSVPAGAKLGEHTVVVCGPVGCVGNVDPVESLWVATQTFSVAAPPSEVPSSEAPSSDVPSSEVPSSDPPSSETPSSDPPSSEPETTSPSTSPTNKPTETPSPTESTSAPPVPTDQPTIGPDPTPGPTPEPTQIPWTLVGLVGALAAVGATAALVRWAMTRLPITGVAVHAGIPRLSSSVWEPEGRRFGAANASVVAVRRPPVTQLEEEIS